MKVLHSFPGRCSGNGRGQCTECETSCSCYPGWIGRCCDERIPRFNWGDPHLLTLDGKRDLSAIGNLIFCTVAHEMYRKMGSENKFLRCRTAIV